MCRFHLLVFFFFFNDTATPEISPLSLHDALPICSSPSIPRCARCTPASPRRGSPPRSDCRARRAGSASSSRCRSGAGRDRRCTRGRSEEHTSELQSRSDLVCRLLLEKKKKTQTTSSKTVSNYNQQTPTTVLLDLGITAVHLRIEIAKTLNVV